MQKAEYLIQETTKLKPDFACKQKKGPLISSKMEKIPKSIKSFKLLSCNNQNNQIKIKLLNQTIKLKLKPDYAHKQQEDL